MWSASSMGNSTWFGKSLHKKYVRKRLKFMYLLSFNVMLQKDISLDVDEITTFRVLLARLSAKKGCYEITIFLFKKMFRIYTCFNCGLAKKKCIMYYSIFLLKKNIDHFLVVKWRRNRNRRGIITRMNKIGIRLIKKKIWRSCNDSITRSHENTAEEALSYRVAYE